MQSIGGLLKAIRKKYNLRQEDLANKLGYKSKSTINKIEQGINEISYDKLLLLVQLFNIDINDLIPQKKVSFTPISDKSNLFISFSGRSGGNCESIANYFKRKIDTYIAFKDIYYHPCSKCSYECMTSICKYRSDDIYRLYQNLVRYNKVFFLIPMYGGSPSSLYYIFNERSQDFFNHFEDYDLYLNKVNFIGIYGSHEEYPDFLKQFGMYYNPITIQNHVIGIERNKYSDQINDLIINKKEVQSLLRKFITRM